VPKVRKPVLECRFYRTAKGHEPVRGWLKALPPAVRKEIGSDVGQVQWRWPIGKPLVDGFGHGLFEVRTALDGNIYRIIFCIRDATILLLHGFQKKSRKTSKADLDLARQRQKETEWQR
jgi:phage-related protein